MTNIRGIPQYPFTVVDIPKDRAIITKLVVNLKKITGSKGCPGLSDATFVDCCVIRDGSDFPYITINRDCDMYRSNTRRYPTVHYSVILGHSYNSPRKELTT